MPDAEGWYEFHRAPAMTTHIAHVGENGYIYVPEEGVTDVDFLEAAVEGRAFRLVRADAQEPTPPIPSDADWEAVRNRCKENPS